MAEGNLDNVNGGNVFDAADLGDDSAARVVREYIENLGIGITDFVNVFRPDVVILGGGVCAQGEKLTAPVEAYVRDHAFGADLGFTPRVVTATLGNRAGIIGASALSDEKRIIKVFGGATSLTARDVATVEPSVAEKEHSAHDLHSYI